MHDVTFMFMCMWICWLPYKHSKLIKYAKCIVVAQLAVVVAEGKSHSRRNKPLNSTKETGECDRKSVTSKDEPDDCW